MGTLTIDIHVHLYGRGDGNTGCFIRGTFLTSFFIPFLRYYHHIPPKEVHEDLDRTYLQMILSHLATSPSIDAMILLAHDKIYDEKGQVDPRTQLYTPNDYLLNIVRHQEEMMEQFSLHHVRSRKRIYAGISVHPNRKDAIDEIYRCKERGAVLIKLLPDSQNFDPAHPRYRTYYETLAKLKLPLLCHSGGEHVLKTLRKEYRNPERLTFPLQCGVTVIAAHCGSHSGLFDRNYYETFSSMARTYAHFYGDTSGFMIPTRMKNIKKILSDGDILKKLIHGSDLPIPSFPASFPQMAPIKKLMEISRNKNPLERDYLAKKAIGFPDSVFERGVKILHLDEKGEKV